MRKNSTIKNKLLRPKIKKIAIHDITMYSLWEAAIKPSIGVVRNTKDLEHFLHLSIGCGVNCLIRCPFHILNVSWMLNRICFNWLTLGSWKINEYFLKIQVKIINREKRLGRKTRCTYSDILSPTPLLEKNYENKTNFFLWIHNFL